MEMCFMTEHQATNDTSENSLAFEMWELIAPKVEREMPELPEDGKEDEEEQMDRLEKAYITEV